jgi:hypothetical protein
VFGSSVQNECPQPSGRKIACPGVSSNASSRPKVAPSRRSTIAVNSRPSAGEMYRSQASAWIPRVMPTSVV